MAGKKKNTAKKSPTDESVTEPVAEVVEPVDAVESEPVAESEPEPTTEPATESTTSELPRILTVKTKSGKTSKIARWLYEKSPQSFEIVSGDS